MNQARVDNSVDRAFRSFLAPDLLILDDLGLSRGRSRTMNQARNRAVEEWLSLFDDPILGNSALDRLANASYQIVIEGNSYREKLSPHRKLLGDRQGSNCLESQWEWVSDLVTGWFQDEPYLSMELRIISSLRLQAVRASFFGLPADNRRW